MSNQIEEQAEMELRQFLSDVLTSYKRHVMGAAPIPFGKARRKMTKTEAIDSIVAHLSSNKPNQISDTEPVVDPEPCDYCKMKGREYTSECELNKPNQNKEGSN